MSIPTKSEAALDIMKKEYYPETWTGGLHRVLCMQGGDDDGSYAKNSEAPASAITLCKPMLLTAIQSMKLFFNNNEEGADHDSLRIADLGCATGYNTLATIDMVVESLRLRYAKECSLEPEFEAFFSDLPSNDFNSLFKSLSAKKSRNYYAAGVPGSFYYRLFAKRKLHIAVSLSALHWLSQIPDAVVDKASPAWNKGRAWIDGAKEEVVEAYAKQSEKDMEDFLRCRKEEILQGGILFMLMGGRPGSQPPENQLGDPDSRAKHPFTNSMDQAWQDLVNEGLIDEETRDGFNIPAYMRSMEEVENAIRKCGGFEIQRMEYKTLVEHSEDKQQEWIKDPVSYGRAKANLVRATLRPIVEAHLGPYLSDQLFKRFEERVSSDFTLLHKTIFYGVIVVCAVRI
ncbi:gibberellic acid methyltransferase 2 [Tripterygium wilfordii]|uniref:Gibberellic acid methyltransferase 2 n=1 Tax=Tripterygium wilfordii TaxID=458696 RepID=A0A7J7BUH9_TRIWF|nr:gibberellic acid methyltransferase 2-like [Tripterygium wilfordii]KAF5725541.1 gibberellic acid methyltransferase 2 [Tripterygium wilfordii]